MSAAREYLRNSLPGFLFRKWRDARNDARLERLSTMEISGIRLDVAGIDLALKKYLEHGKYEEAEIAACKQYLHSDDSVLEIGSAIGFVGLYCQKHLGIRRYTSVEANAQTIVRLRENYRLNNLIPEVRHLALGVTDGEIDFHVGPLFWADSAVANSESARVVRVPSATLQTILSSIPQPPTVLILDVEGGELALGALPLPSTLRLAIIELHPKIIGAEATCKLLTNWIRQGFALIDLKADVHVLKRD